MLIPLIGFILGIALLLEAVLAYKGIYLRWQTSVASKQKGNVPLAIGSILIATALILGIVGYFSLMDANRLRWVRIIVGMVGILLVSVQLRSSIRGVIRRVISLVDKLRYLLSLQPQWRAKLYLLTALVQRDLEARYKGSILGNLWPLLNQLSQLLIYTYVFSIVLRVRLSLKGLPANNITFGLWLFAGLLPWIALTSGLMPAAGSVIGQPNLVKKVVFPLSLLPLVPILSAFIESSFGLMALIVLIAASSQTLHATVALLPLVWLTQLLLTSGLGYLAAGLTVFLRDVPQTLGMILNFWFYLTPICYPAEAIPETWRSWVFWLNPMAAIAELYRDLILVGEVKHWGEWGAAVVISIIFFVCGFSVYKRLRPGFADVL